eukprot:9136377-Prorocentrum_lima.AAC.1
MQSSTGFQDQQVRDLQTDAPTSTRPDYRGMLRPRSETWRDCQPGFVHASASLEYLDSDFDFGFRLDVDVYLVPDLDPDCGHS